MQCNLDKEVELPEEGVEISSKERDLVVGKVYSKIMEIESRLLPCGLHVIGEPPSAMEAVATLVNIAALDRPEDGITCLPSILAHTVGREIEDVYRGSDRGILKDVELLRQITETSRGAITAFVEKTTNDKGQVVNVNDKLSSILGFGINEPWIQYLSNTKFYTADRDKLRVLFGFLGECLKLVGGPARQDHPRAVEALMKLDVPYIVALPLVFQTTEEWLNSTLGLHPIQVALQVALPELDGGMEPIVFSRRDPRTGKSHALHKRVEQLCTRAIKWAELKRKTKTDKKLAITVFSFPPDKGNVGTAAYLNVFASIFSVLQDLKKDGYNVEGFPETAEALIEDVIHDKEAQFNSPLNNIFSNSNLDAGKRRVNGGRGSSIL